MIKKKWDMFAESVSMSLSNIAGNKMRTFLTTLGIIIGVGAIIALMTVVQGATDTMNAQFDAMGLGTLRVSVTGTAIKHGLTDDDLQTILDCEHVAGISPSLNATVTAKRGNVWSDSISVNGNNDEYFRHNPGSAPTRSRHRRVGCGKQRARLPGGRRRGQDAVFRRRPRRADVLSRRV